MWIGGLATLPLFSLPCLPFSLLSPFLPFPFPYEIKFGAIVALKYAIRYCNNFGYFPEFLISIFNPKIKIGGWPFVYATEMI